MSDEQGASVVINADDGTRHVFPPGFDPVKAAAIVRSQSQTAAPTPAPAGAWDHPIADAWEGVKTGLGKLLPFGQPAPVPMAQQAAALKEQLKNAPPLNFDPRVTGRAVVKSLSNITPKDLGEGAADLGAMYAGGKLAGAVEPTRVNIGQGLQTAGDLVDLRQPFKALSVIGKKMEASGTAARDAAVSRDRYLPSTSGYDAADQGAPQGPLPQSTASMVDPHMPNVSGTPDGGLPQGPLPQSTIIDPHMPNTSGYIPGSALPQGAMPAPVQVDRYMANTGGAPTRDLATFKSLSAMPPEPPQVPDAPPMVQVDEPFEGENQQRLPGYRAPAAPAPKPPVRPQPDEAGPAGMLAKQNDVGGRDAAAKLGMDPDDLRSATGQRGKLPDAAAKRIDAYVSKLTADQIKAESLTTTNPKLREALLASLAAAGKIPD